MSAAVAKATVMRLLAIPRLPVPLPVDRTLLARNRPGPADSFLLVLLLSLLWSILLQFLLPCLLLSNLLLSPSFLLVCSSLIPCLALPSVFSSVLGPRS